MDEIYCYLVNMPPRIKATVIANIDHTYTIYINKRLSVEAQQKAYLHELKHIENGDLSVEYLSANSIELRAHGVD